MTVFCNDESVSNAVKMHVEEIKTQVLANEIMVSSDVTAVDCQEFGSGVLGIRVSKQSN